MRNPHRKLKSLSGLVPAFEDALAVQKAVQKFSKRISNERAKEVQRIADWAALSATWVRRCG